MMNEGCDCIGLHAMAMAMKQIWRGTSFVDRLSDETVGFGGADGICLI